MVKSTYLLILAGASMSTAFVVPPSTIKKTITYHQVLNLCENENFSLERISEKARQLSNRENDFNRFLALNSLAFLTPFYSVANAVAKDVAPAETNGIMEAIIPAIGGCFAVSFVVAFALEFMSIEDDEETETSPHLLPLAESLEKETKSIAKEVQKPSAQTLEVPSKRMPFDSSVAKTTVPIRDSKPATGKKRSPMKLDASQSVTSSTPEPLERVSEVTSETETVAPVEPVVNTRMPFDSSAIKAKVPSKDSKSADKKKTPVQLDASQSVFASYLEVVNRAMSLTVSKPLERVSEVTSEIEETETVTHVESVVNTRMPFDSSAIKAKVPSKDSKPTDKKKTPVKLDASQSVFASYLEVVNRAPKITERKPLVERQESVLPVEPVVEKPAVSISSKKSSIPMKDSKPAAGKKKAPAKLNASQSVFASYLEVVNRAMSLTVSKPLERVSEVTSETEETETVTHVEPVVNTRMPFDSSAIKAKVPSKDSKQDAGKKKAPVKLDAPQSVFASYLEVVNRAPTFTKRKPLEIVSDDTSEIEESENALPVEPVVEKPAVSISIPMKDSKPAAGKKKAPAKLDASNSVFASYLDIVNRAPKPVNKAMPFSFAKSGKDVKESTDLLSNLSNHTSASATGMNNTVI